MWFLHMLLAADRLAAVYIIESQSSMVPAALLACCKFLFHMHVSRTREGCVYMQSSNMKYRGGQGKASECNDACIYVEHIYPAMYHNMYTRKILDIQGKAKVDKINAYIKDAYIYIYIYIYISARPTPSFCIFALPCMSTFL
jgi:hypothetical protein